MFRYLVLFSWIVVFILLLFRFKGHFISEPLKESLEHEQLQRQITFSPAPQTKEESREMIIAIIRIWDFEKFYGAVHPELSRQIPAGGLRELFRGVGESLGGLQVVHSSRIQGFHDNTESFTIKADATFSKGRALIEADFLKTDNGWKILRFAVESPEVAPVYEAAEAARQKDRFDPSAFRKSLAARL